MEKSSLSTPEINTLLVGKTRNFFKNRRKTKAVLGLSGGIDSALTLSFLVEALGKEHVTAILMPNEKITKQSNVFDAENFAKSLKINYFIVPIRDFVESFSKLPWKQSNVAEANLNARIRALILYSFANSFTALVAGTGNKSEFYLGYFTKHGDAAADFFLIGDLLKKQVREVAKFRGLPKEFLEKAPSAELWVDQEDEKELGFTYEVVDHVLPLILENREAEIPSDLKLNADRIKSIIEFTEHKREKPEIFLL